LLLDLRNIPKHSLFLLNQTLAKTKTAQHHVLAVSGKLMPPRGFEYHPFNRDHGSNKKRLIAQAIFSAPTGIRTPVVALKGLRPSPLDDGGLFVALEAGGFYHSPLQWSSNFAYFSSFAR